MQSACDWIGHCYKEDKNEEDLAYLRAVSNAPLLSWLHHGII